jgi:hypothetical protein
MKPQPHQGYLESCRCAFRSGFARTLEPAEKRQNKPHHPTARSRSVDMFSRIYNLIPVRDFRPSFLAVDVLYVAMAALWSRDNMIFLSCDFYTSRDLF